MSERTMWVLIALCAATVVALVGYFISTNALKNGENQRQINDLCISGGGTSVPTDGGIACIQ